MKTIRFRATFASVIMIFITMGVGNANCQCRTMALEMSLPIRSSLDTYVETQQHEWLAPKSLKKRVKVRVADELNLTWDNTTSLFVHDKKYESALKLLKKAPVRFIDSMYGSRKTNAWHCEVEGYLSQGDLAFILYVECFDPPMMDLFHTQMDFAWCQFGAAHWLNYFRQHRPLVILKLTSYLRTSSDVQPKK